jgi:hypothetical protein
MESGEGNPTVSESNIEERSREIENRSLTQLSGVPILNAKSRLALTGKVKKGTFALAYPLSRQRVVGVKLQGGEK